VIEMKVAYPDRIEIGPIEAFLRHAMRGVSADV
jgi:hypothetical protein